MLDETLTYPQPARTAARAFLLSALAAGPKDVTTLLEEATAAKISKATLLRAKTALGIVVHQRWLPSGRNAWVWELPQKDPFTDPW